MANPQPDKFTKLSTEFLEALCRIRIAGEAMQVLLTIIRKTWGYQKKEDSISLNQFSEATGLSKVHICGAINKLISMNIITKKGNGYIYSIQKNYDLWRPLPKKVILPKMVKIITENGNEPLPKKVTTIDNIDNRYKEIGKPAQSRTHLQAVNDDWLLKINTELQNKYKIEFTPSEINKLVKDKFRAYDILLAFIQGLPQNVRKPYAYLLSVEPKSIEVVAKQVYNQPARLGEVFKKLGK